MYFAEQSFNLPWANSMNSRSARRKGSLNSANTHEAKPNRVAGLIELAISTGYIILGFPSSSVAWHTISP